MKALACHKSQVGDVPTEMRERMKQFARMNAADEKFELAETFHRVELKR
jgi:hypothetical protein